MKADIPNLKQQSLARVSDIKAKRPTAKQDSPTFAAMGAPKTEPIQKNLMNWIAPAAQQRWLGPGMAQYTPQFVEQVWRQALSGDLQSEWELFDIMKSTAPRLMKNINQIIDAVIAAGIQVKPFLPRGTEAPSESAIERADRADEALRTMAPRPDCDENDLNKTSRDLLDAKMNAHSILETQWEVRARADGSMMTAPRCTRWVHPAWYGYPKGPMDGQVMLRGQPWTGLDQSNLNNYYSGGGNTAGFAEMPEHKFIVGIAKNKTGHPLGSAKLHTLANLWAMANFSTEWLLNLAQIFGQPFRWANYDPNMTPGDQQKLVYMLQNMGSAAWAAFPAGTQLQLVEAVKTTSEAPQYVIMQYFDSLCDIVILGQTLTTDMAPSGGARAGGEVHERILDDVEMSYARWLCDTLQQLVQSICYLNYGDCAECPEVCPPVEEEDESGEIIMNLKTLADAGLEPADEELPELSKRIGFKVQRKAAPAANDEEDEMPELKAKDFPQSMDEVDELAAKHAPEVAAAMRSSFAPAVAIIRDSKSPAEAEQRLRAHFADWRPGQLVAALTPPLQKAAALGAISAKLKR